MNMIHHGAAIHIPLALAVLFPPAHLLFCVLIKRKYFPESAWLLLLVLCGVQVAGSALSYFTGKQAMAFSMAQEDLLNRHLDLAWKFSWIWAAIAVLLVVAFVPREKVLRNSAHLILLVAFVLQFAIAIQLGQIGGELIHGN